MPKVSFTHPFSLVSFFCLLLIVSACGDKEVVDVTKTVEKAPLEKEEIEYGFRLNDYWVVRDTIQKGENFGELLTKNNLDYGKIYEISNSLKEDFDVRRLRAGKKYTILKTKDSLAKPVVFIYQDNVIDYVVIDFRDSILLKKEKMPVTLRQKTATGVINSSLSNAIINNGLDYDIVNRLSDIYAWSIDFFRLQPGDRFKIIYTEKYINDSVYAGIDRINATYFEHNDKPFYAFRYVADSVMQIPDFYDDEGNTLRSQFLRAPLKFSRISSRFSPNRFHPVQKRWKAHKGTDYAAPTGTPIMSTANGTVIEAGYTSGNGNYVKVRHNGTYTTQYLHMSKILVKKGQFVKQGDVLGKVGSTGLATGPHVCYRFWKNGVQVDPYKQDLPAAEPIKESVKAQYFTDIDPLKKQLDQLYFEPETTITQTQ
ncbi:MAG: peptidoglycan DD-metalloendopeptidase family protein [Bacteroidetes bacterium]|nr:peptidoglycan DD-metalloendopeptidase family protein [Bacteroidota bacterium]